MADESLQFRLAAVRYSRRGSCPLRRNSIKAINERMGTFDIVASKNEHLLEIGLPTYARFLAHNSTIRPRSFSERFGFIFQPFNNRGQSVFSTDPLFSYALIFLSKPENAAEAEVKERKKAAANGFGSPTIC